MREFPYSRCITYTCRLQFWQPGAASRINHIQDWMDTNIGKSNFEFRFEDYGQHGEYVIKVNTEEDLTAFILACENKI